MTRNEVTRMVLEGARERISDPVRWTQGYAGEGPEDPVCAVMAIRQIAHLLRGDRVQYVESAKDALRRVLPRSLIHDEEIGRAIDRLLGAIERARGEADSPTPKRFITLWNDSATHE